MKSKKRKEASEYNPNRVRRVRSSLLLVGISFYLLPRIANYHPFTITKEELYFMTKILITPTKLSNDIQNNKKNKN